MTPRFELAFAEIGAHDEAELSAAERAVLERFRHPGRRAAFVAGRVAAKRAFAKLTGLTGKDEAFEVIAGPSGEPLSVLPGFGVSISHSGEFAAAVVYEKSSQPGEMNVGIDLEEIRQIAVGVEDQFCDETELEALSPGFAGRSSALTEDERIARELQVLRRWSAKEAIYKAAFPALGPDLRRIRLRSLAADGFASDDYTVTSQWLPSGYVLSIASGYGKISTQGDSL